jgi:hypothetical protein
MEHSYEGQVTSKVFFSFQTYSLLYVKNEKNRIFHIYLNFMHSYKTLNEGPL